MSKKAPVWRYKYIGEYACSVVNPPSEWLPGDEKDVPEPINNVNFVLVDAKAPDVPSE